MFCASLSAQTPYVTITGTLQGPNGLPAANQILSFTPTQNFFVVGQGAVCNSYIFQINAATLTCGDTINFNNNVPAAPPNALNINWRNVNSAGTDVISAYLQGDGVATHCLLGTGR